MVERNIRRRRLPIEDAAIEFAFSRAIVVRDQARQDDGRVDRHVRKHVYALNYYLRRLITEQPYIGKIKTGKIISVDTGAKTCVAAIEGEQALIDNIKYYPPNRPPKIQGEYAVHFEIKLPTRTINETSEPEPVERWIKLFEGERWIYRKNSTETVMLRYGWPPPDEPENWTVETVREELDEDQFLFGSSTPEDESTQIVLTKPTFSGFDIVDFHYYHYSNMGFGDEDQEGGNPYVLDYGLNPQGDPNPLTGLFALYRLLSIANDGINTAAGQLLYTLQPLQDGYFYQNSLVLLERIECCLVSPIDSNTYCIFTNALGYEFTQVILPPEQNPKRTDSHARLFLGEFGEMVEEERKPREYEVFSTTEELPPLTYPYPNSTECEWFGGNPSSGVVVWTDPSSSNVEYPYPSDVTSPEQIRHIGEQYDQPAITGSWNYVNTETNERERTDTFVQFIRTNVLITPAVGSPFVQSQNFRWRIVSFGQVEFDVIIPDQDMGPVAIALNLDNDIEVWWSKFDDAAGAQKVYRMVFDTDAGGSAGELEDMTINDLTCLSRDGVDAVGWVNLTRTTRKQVYTIDRGEEWKDLPAIEHEDAPEVYIPNGVKFVDEI